MNLKPEKQNSVDSYIVDISDISPSQLFISERKYKFWLQEYKKEHEKSFQPLPVKKIGDSFFFTDGHSRAMALWHHGHRKISVYNDTDDLDWIAYLADLELCKNSGIRSIADLQDRIVSYIQFDRMWLQPCEEKKRRLENDKLIDLKLDFERSKSRKSAICSEILRALPEWFGIESAIRDYSKDIREMPFVGVSLYGKVIGFCAIKVHFSIHADLYVLGVFKEFHNLGIGKRLIQFIENYCRDNDIKYLTVKTLSARHKDPFYRRTRKFYEALGFIPFEEFTTLWGESNPCLYMFKNLFQLT